MNPMRVLSLLALLAVAVMGKPGSSRMDNTVSQALKPSQWLSGAALEAIPAADDLTVERLENMSLEKGAELLQQIYHLSQINHNVEPNFVPSASNIQVYVPQRNGEKIVAPLTEMIQRLKQKQNFADDEVTIIITGLPSTTETVKKANRKLVQAYMQRYNLQQQRQQGQGRDYDDSNEKKGQRTSSEENSSEESKNAKTQSGDVIVIDLGATLTNYKRYAMLDIEKTGAKIGKWIVQMVNELDMPFDTIHLIGQGVSAHVAGASAQEFTRLTGHKLRRVTGLDPSKIVAKTRQTLTGLARGDAEFVDAIHTSVYGMGTRVRSADADFYPNGPAAGVPGAENVIEATMRATRYFAESVRPGNERSFPAVPANSLQQYKQNDGFGKRAYMGIDAAHDIEGDYMLQVNAKSPFGRNAPAQKQSSYHGVHQTWKNDDKDYE
ncbi:vitellogenin-1 [Drosophila guanche]|uniref:Blast:Vitellogenin-1 n=1 Tax=Drosophila guanche TaxID=7266 RepID=A0A3B0JD64_DROGU|nr:vitellogenin-1 [Drosophila guanche]SPP78042.1 blast:Vitellogenin-1 [Drosophila guanche]